MPSDAARAVITAALEDDALLSPGPGGNPARAQRVAEYLIASGYRLTCPIHRRPGAGPVPVRALRTIRRALDLHDLLVHPGQRTPASRTTAITTDLHTDGWTISPDTTTRSAA